LLIAAPHIRIPLEEFSFQAARSSGPGGQHVNKTNSKVILRWNVKQSATLHPGVRKRFLDTFGSRISSEGELVLNCEEHRSQHRNRETCLERLKDMLASVAYPPKKRRPTKPTRGSKEARLKGKRHHSEKKQNRRNPRNDD
jgi:ribosome-associated protein